MEKTPNTIRLPKRGETDPYWSATRGWWNDRILPCKRNGFNPPIKSILIKERGAKRGTRFIVYSSAAEYFRKAEEAA